MIPLSNPSPLTGLAFILDARHRPPLAKFRRNYIIEAINNLDSNQYAPHTTSECFLGTNSIHSGSILQTYFSTGAGLAEVCLRRSLDVSGIYVWFRPRGSLPASISQANSSSTINLTDWDTPTAAYLFNACNIAQYFQPQQLIIGITLCSVWAGVPSIHNFTGCSGQCIDNVISTGNLIYNNASWDIAYTRSYLATATTTLTMGNAKDKNNVESNSQIRVPKKMNKNTHGVTTALYSELEEDLCGSSQRILKQVEAVGDHFFKSFRPSTQGSEESPANERRGEALLKKWNYQKHIPKN
ncbi:glycoside hydrolase family 16 protein [Lentinula edodes]|uniref:Glycoside hydrolase family 16 protein n=1 Tax=Lentinula edodes TaxID=5353 RepID=A0A1Q3ENI2_LENED|nr:glycoside hydrolase family 16 protein [Lentinula edodes]